MSAARPARASRFPVRPPGSRGTASFRALLAWLAPAVFAAVLATAAIAVSAAPDASAAWRRVSTSDGSAATQRHEAGGVAVDGRLYLLGGRGVRPLEVYDPATRRWQNLGTLPEAIREIHHFQPVAVGRRIYIVGALRCCYPREPVERTVHVYDTVAREWSTAGEMPLERARGSAATVVRDGLIYVLGGNRLGHDGGSVDWFDVFDPASGEWRTLPDAPNARDHFTAGIAGGRLIAAGGRTTDLPVPFDKAVRATDVYDFSSGRWTTGADIPTVRAGTVSAVVDGELIVLGGEIAGSGDALRAVEAYDVDANRWRTLQPMQDGRHGGAAAIIGDTLHAVAGSRGLGGGPETSSHETLALGEAAPIDTDDDGLEDDDERDVWMTDPALADTDADGLDDGDETARGTDPLVADSDTDGLDDGDEIERGTDPLVADSDADGLDDGDEVTRRGTDPLVADGDADGLDDGDEVERGTDPLDADSDDDGLADGVEVNVHGTDPLDADSDDDGLADGAEVDVHGTRVLAADSDDDGLADGVEVDVHGTDPLDADSDDDGVTDGEEVSRSTDPRDADSGGRRDGTDEEPTTPPVTPTTPPTTPPTTSPTTSPPEESSGGGGGAPWTVLLILGVIGLSRSAYSRR